MTEIIYIAFYAIFMFSITVSVNVLNLRFSHKTSVTCLFNIAPIQLECNMLQYIFPYITDVKFILPLCDRVVFVGSKLLIYFQAVLQKLF